jgi:signal transduction histidine kinase
VIRQDPLGILVAAWSAEVPPSPEVRAFAAQVAELATLLAAHASLARQAVEARSNERLASALASQRDGLVRQIVHDLRNAVHILGLAAEEIDRKAADPVRVRAALSPLARQADFMAAYLEKQLRSLDEDSLEAPSPASLEAAFKHAGGELGRHVAEHGRRLKVGTCQPATLRIGQVQLTEILAGLIRAAVPLADPGGALELWAAVSDGWATIILEEDGPSLDRDDREALPASAHGAGGLAEVEELVAAAGGHFGVRSRPGERMSFHIGLPTVDWGGGALQ